MSSGIIIMLVLLGIALLLALWLMGVYNGPVVAGNRFKNAFAQIDVQLKRRYDRARSAQGVVPVTRNRSALCVPCSQSRSDHGQQFL